MKLEEIKPQKRGEDLYIIVEVSETLVPKSALLEEGIWVETGKKDLMCRVDPARPEMSQQRHVHIAHKKHVAAKKQQAAWNEDGTRHDKSSFNEKFGSLRAVQAVARDALSLEDSVVLEDVTPSSVPLVEGVQAHGDAAVLLRASSA